MSFIAAPLNVAWGLKAPAWTWPSVGWQAPVSSSYRFTLIRILCPFSQTVLLWVSDWLTSSRPKTNSGVLASQYNIEESPWYLAKTSLKIEDMTIPPLDNQTFQQASWSSPRMLGSQKSQVCTEREYNPCRIPLLQCSSCSETYCRISASSCRLFSPILEADLSSPRHRSKGRNPPERNSPALGSPLHWFSSCSKGPLNQPMVWIGRKKGRICSTSVIASRMSFSGFRSPRNRAPLCSIVLRFYREFTSFPIEEVLLW